MSVSTEQRFFLYAQERQRVLRSRQSGAPRPWTTDPILNEFRFCNVYREDDATTQWFRKHVRDPLRSRHEVLLATVLFRWFNRIVTGEAIFLQQGDYEDPARGRITSAWQLFLETGSTSAMRHTIMSHCGSGPYVTGAYIIKTPDGMNKLDGVLWCMRGFYQQKMLTDAGSMHGWREAADFMLSPPGTHPTLECVWDWLRKFAYLGDFMAYEIVTDLRHTALLDRAPDIRTWANPGPGAMRGMNRISGRDLDKKLPKHVYVCEMRRLMHLAEEQYRGVWPHRPSHEIEMRDIEHTLCEFDKYERVRLGQGRPRGVYR